MIPLLFNVLSSKGFKLFPPFATITLKSVRSQNNVLSHVTGPSLGSDRRLHAGLVVLFSYTAIWYVHEICEYKVLVAHSKSKKYMHTSHEHFPVKTQYFDSEITKILPIYI
jgi:hypothetical protein